ncbi:hypothetical protein QLX08_004929 [Tetragonisca angustula]|uniref:Uncharacterized protein n=1 Tax=Tetragonisca angustula TaxID=166442 RepID=A0AAW1A0T3_9HYME
MSTTLEDALSIYPPSHPSRCESRRTCFSTCPPCPNIQPPISGTSSVRFQVTYTCDGPKYSPCYYPRSIRCPPPEIQPPKITPCYVRLFDSRGRPICLYF